MGTSKQDRHGARTPADLEQRYSFGKTFAEVYGLAERAQTAATDAKVHVDKLDNSLTQEEIFNRLTKNGEMQGVYMEDGELYISAEYIADVAELFAQNITMTGKFTTTAEVFLEPGKQECDAIKEIIIRGTPPTASEVALYDADGDGTVDIMDATRFRFAYLGRRSLTESWEGASPLKKSTVIVTIDISNPRKAIRIQGTNMWGREIDSFFGSSSIFLDDDCVTTFNEMMLESNFLTLDYLKAAPAGYGLGGAQPITWDTIDDTVLPGFYSINGDNAIKGVTAGDWYLIVYGVGLGCTQELRPVGTFKEVKLVRTRYGEWGEWEFDNPPMVLGTEYRTTERWQNKAVYTKLVDFGALPNASMKQVAHGAAATNIIRYAGTRNNGEAIPMWYSNYTILIDVSVSSIVITTSFDASARTAVVQIWYTKD